MLLPDGTLVRDDDNSDGPGLLRCTDGHVSSSGTASSSGTFFCSECSKKGDAGHDKVSEHLEVVNADPLPYTHGDIGATSRTDGPAEEAQNPSSSYLSKNDGGRANGHSSLRKFVKEQLHSRDVDKHGIKTGLKTPTNVAAVMAPGSDVFDQ
ncbi:hypothetical protein K525DRAFT_274375 [Schizophyllum commune Loenen D]|nr:hypothetical protein K525DRAFT_274375 [Schizophyllum commune Loenen D]